MFVDRASARILGILVSIACIGWVGWRFYATGAVHQAIEEGRAGTLFVQTVSAAPIYALAVLVLSAAWAALQRVFVRGVPVTPTMSIYLITQVGKYLPGSVVQYVGRHVGLRRLGMTHASLLLSSLAEAGCLVAVALLASAPLATHWFPKLSTIEVFASIAVAALTAVGAIVWLRSQSLWIARRIPLFSTGWLVLAMTLHIIFFGLMTLTLKMVADGPSLAGVTLAGWAAVASASWIAGYLVIGAPAGLGVREAVFVTLLSGHGSSSAVLLVAASFRLATFIGDVLACAGGMMWRRFYRAHAGSDGRGNSPLAKD